MFDKETRWFICCDTCPDDGYVNEAHPGWDKDEAKAEAVSAGWNIRDDLHRCPHCVREGRTERAS
jgi:hypothetical protein